MKKTTLLMIGALAFVLQIASAQTTIYSQDFENQSPGDTPQDWSGNNMWTWVGNASSTTWDVATLPNGEVTTQGAVLSWNFAAGSTWGGYSSGDSISWIPGDNNGPTDLTFSMDLASAAGNTTATLWFVQKNASGSQIWAASYLPVLNTDGSWTHVQFRISDLTVQYPGNQNQFLDSQLPVIMNVDGSGDLTAPLSTLWMDNILMVAANPIPEPGTIALLTLGGLGALVAIRRRRA